MRFLQKRKLLLFLLSIFFTWIFIVSKGLQWTIQTVQRGSNVSHDSIRHYPDLTLSIDDTVAESLRRKWRVMCWVVTKYDWLGDRVQAINNTWIPRCDGHVYFMHTPNGTRHPDLVSLKTSEDTKHLTAKVVEAMTFMYHKDADNYDWFLKADADTYVIMENLRFLLESYSPDQPVHLGDLFHRHVRQGYMTGGAGVVLSRYAFKKVMEEGFLKNKCRTDSKMDDVRLGECLEKVGIPPHNSHDKYGRVTIHTDDLYSNIVRPAEESPLQAYARFPPGGGKECCSELTVTFHHIQPDMMYILDHLLYRTTVYGRTADWSRFQGMFQPSEITPPEVWPYDPQKKKKTKQERTKGKMIFKKIKTS